MTNSGSDFTKKKLNGRDTLIFPFDRRSTVEAYRFRCRAFGEEHVTVRVPEDPTNMWYISSAQSNNHDSFDFHFALPA
jgi:hypothetical protein